MNLEIVEPEAGGEVEAEAGVHSGTYCNAKRQLHKNQKRSGRHMRLLLRSRIDGSI